MPNTRKEKIEDPNPIIEEPSPLSNKKRPGIDKLFERMRKVDPQQSKNYKQRTGE